MKLRPLTIMVALAILLSGCAEYQQAQEHLKLEGARATDAFLETSEFGICTAASVGAVMRRYGGNPEQAAAWQLFCEGVWKQQAGQELDLFGK